MGHPKYNKTNSFLMTILIKTELFTFQSRIFQALLNISKYFSGETLSLKLQLRR